MYRFLIASCLLVVLALLAVLAISSTEPVPDLVLINGAPIHELDPAKMSWMHDIRTAFGLWEGLLTTDPQTMASIPGVAEKYDVSPGGRTYSFTLRADARWSNGDPVTAEDFRFAWLRVLDPAAADYYSYMLLIQGAQPYYDSMLALRQWEEKRRVHLKDPTAPLPGEQPQPPDPRTVGIEVVSERELRVVLVEPAPYFAELVAFSTFLPVHRASMQKFLIDRPDDVPPMYDPDWLRPGNLVTNGPFVLTRWDFGRRLLLERNPFYWDRAHVPSERLELREDSDLSTAFLSYQSGAADVITSLPDQVAQGVIEQARRGERNDLHLYPVWGTYYYRFNCQKPPLDDPRVRQALTLCVDRVQIVRRITKRGEPAQSSFITPGLSVPLLAGRAPAARSGPGWELSEDGRALLYVPVAGLAFDPAKAKALLAEAGYGPGGRAFPAITLLVNSGAGHEPVAEAIIQMWRTHLGIEVKLESLISTIARNRMKEHQFDVCRSGWFTDYGDPTGFLMMFQKGDGNNDGQFSVPEYDQLLVQAGKEADPARRYELLGRAEQLLVVDHAGVLPIYQYVGQFLYRPGIRGIYENPKQQIMLKGVFKKKE